MSGAVNVILVGDSALADWASEIDIAGAYNVESEDVRAVYLSRGMKSGKPSCLIAARCSHGDLPPTALIEMSVEMFLTIAGAFKAKYEMEGFTWV